MVAAASSVDDTNRPSTNPGYSNDTERSMERRDPITTPNHKRRTRIVPRNTTRRWQPISDLLIVVVVVVCCCVLLIAADGMALDSMNKTDSCWSTASVATTTTGSKRERKSDRNCRNHNHNHNQSTSSSRITPQNRKKERR